MMKEAGVALTGILSALAVFFLVATSSLAPYSPSTTETAPFRGTQLPQTFSGAYRRFDLPGMGVLFSGILPTLVLVIIAILAGLFLSRLSPRIMRNGEIS